MKPIRFRNRFGWHVWITYRDDRDVFVMLEDDKQMPIGFALEPLLVTELPIRRFSTQKIHLTIPLSTILDGAHDLEVEDTVQGDLFAC